MILSPRGGSISSPDANLQRSQSNDGVPDGHLPNVTGATYIVVTGRRFSARREQEKDDMPKYIIARRFEDEPEDFWGGFDEEWGSEADAKLFDSEEAAAEEGADLHGDDIQVREIPDEPNSDDNLLMDQLADFFGDEDDDDRDEDEETLRLTFINSDGRAAATADVPIADVWARIRDWMEQQAAGEVRVQHS